MHSALAFFASAKASLCSLPFFEAASFTAALYVSLQALTAAACAEGCFCVLPFANATGEATHNAIIVDTAIFLNERLIAILLRIVFLQGGSFQVREPTAQGIKAISRPQMLHLTDNAKLLKKMSYLA